MPSLNLGIVAHVDAGKTSLTERLLYAAGVIDHVGSVDAGDTQTDTMALERERGITIRSAVVSFAIDDVTVNLIDTPGHSDFIAEVERVLGVLDGAVLVVSAVEGVQAQTRVLMRALQRLRIPTLVFVNKVDRTGADPDAVLCRLRDQLSPAVVGMGVVRAAGTSGAAYRLHDDTDAGHAAALADVLTRADEHLLADWVADGRLPASRLHSALATQTRRALVHPVFAGSAITGAGVDELRAGIAALLPSVDGDDGPPSGTVFKIERGRAGERLAYVRMHAGTVRVRDRVRLARGADATVTGLQVFRDGSAVQTDSVTAGQIAKVVGLTDVRIGDHVGAGPARRVGPAFARPSLETVVDPVHAGDKGALHAALSELAEQDPLIDVRQDDVRREISVSLYGEVQKEVVQATLARDYGIDVTFRETTTICIERVVGVGEAAEAIKKGDNPFLATVGLRVEPAPPGTGVVWQLGVELGSMPLAFFVATEQTVRETLRQGLHGWEIPDCVVTMTRSGYWPRQSHMHGTFDASMSSTAGDFRKLTPLVLVTALRQAGTRVAEPVHRFELELPADALGAALRALAHLGGVPLTTEPHGAAYLICGDVPAARVHDLRTMLPGLTRGEGVLGSELSHHADVRGPAPSRERTDDNPLDRREYLMRLGR